MKAAAIILILFFLIAYLAVRLTLIMIIVYADILKKRAAEKQ